MSDVSRRDCHRKSLEKWAKEKKRVTLTFREYQVAQMVMRGMTEKEIENVLGVRASIGIHRQHLAEKLDAHSMSHLALAMLSSDTIIHVSGYKKYTPRRIKRMPMSEIVVDVKDARAEAQALFDKLVWSDDPVDQLRADALARVIEKMDAATKRLNRGET